MAQASRSRRAYCHVIPKLEQSGLLSIALFTGQVQGRDMQLNRHFNDIAANRIAILLAVVAFPFVDHAQFGIGIDAAKASAGTAAITRAVANSDPAPDACAVQHWPFYSRECLRGADQAIAPRQVSLNDNSVTELFLISSAKAAAKNSNRSDIDAVQPLRPSKAVKPRVASPRKYERSRRSIQVDEASAGTVSAFASTW
ncbi:MAG: hypothetical protein JWR49_3856 [Tardiphaga sp.]|nr:hypothetical protein [Tardiphaga sp.]